MKERVKKYLTEKLGFHFHEWQYTDEPPMAITPSSERWYYYVMECKDECCDVQLYVMGFPTDEMRKELAERRFNELNPKTRSKNSDTRRIKGV